MQRRYTSFGIVVCWYSSHVWPQWHSVSGLDWSKDPGEEIRGFPSIWPDLFLFKPVLSVAWSWFQISKAHTFLSCTCVLGQRGALCSASVDVASCIPWTSIAVGTCGMLPRFHRPRFFDFGLYYERSCQCTSWALCRMAHRSRRTHWDGSSAVPSRCRTKCRRVSVSRTSNG